MKKSHPLQIIVLLMAVPSTGLAPGQEGVGAWGDPARIVLQGIHSYDAGSIQRALSRSPDLLGR